MNFIDRFFKTLAILMMLVGSCMSTSLPGNQQTIDTSKKIKVAIFKDKGAHPRGNLLVALETALDMTVTPIDGEELRGGYLNNFDLLLVPGGSAVKESYSMKKEGREEVRRFVANGGLYMGICAGCYLLTESRRDYLGLLPLKTRDRAHWRRGKGTLPVELTQQGKEIFGTNQNMFNILYHNGPVIDASHVTAASHFVVLGYYRGELVARRGKPGVMVDSPAMFMGTFGKGLVLGISPHPEATVNQVNMEMNAIRWLYAHRTK